MPAANALNYLALQDAVLGRRFPAASQRPNAKRWLATAYQDVWSALESPRMWTFSRVSLAALTVSSATPTMPSDFGEVIDLYDENGIPLTRLSQEEFEPVAVSQVAQGPPYVYMSLNRQVTLAPTPSGSLAYKISYRRRLSHKESDGSTVTGGFMDEEDDYPLWDDHHSVLIPRATAVGLIEVNDPTWEQAQEEYERQLMRMREDYEYERPQQQWAKSCWY